ncbi:MFS general substrate transporter [Setomelanomma holmii]|uniref:Actin cytoskeleton-regulatory complex protein SLA1 n=1 Tax=Setomelanomma holmii TaxID=210430 RepID=A0A9P4HL13_9PLEO|nr:MFS general substrate transporter [Setomelanomma holmii]
MTKGPPSQVSEKDSVQEVQDEEQGAIATQERDRLEEEWQKNIRLKVDLRLCSIAGILCSLNLLDSGVISSASVTSMLSDLELNVGNRYSVSIFIFTIASIAFQLPSTIAVRTFGPRIWFAFITFCFGIITMCTAFVQTWRQMIALRILLGIAMSGIYPGLTVLISAWYTRKEQQLRFAFMQSGEVMVLATGSIVNFGLNQLNYKGGLKGWQRMFVVQGSITAFFGILTYWWMIDFPEDSHRSFYFLDKSESEIASARIQNDRGDVKADNFALSKVLVHAKDPKVYGFCVLYFLQNLVSTSLSYFLPIILQGGMGFSTNKSILLSAPPYYYAVIPAILSSLVGDKLQLRGPIITFNCITLIIGFCMLGFTDQVTVRYIGTYLATGAYVANWAAMATYQANNIVGQWKRIFTAAAVTAFNGAGGIAGSFIVRQQESPRYMTAIWWCAAPPYVTMVFLGIYRAIYDYVPQSDNEIALNEGDVLMVLEKSSDDDWWKAKKKGREDEEEEPEGLIPNNYIEEAAPILQARALYDYDRQTDEELSFKEEAVLDVYDTTDPDWALVGEGGSYGFAPANYIELTKGGAASAAPAIASPPLPTRPSIPAAPDSDDEQPPTPDSPPHQSPAAALAGIIQKKSEQTAAPRSTISPPPNVGAKAGRRVQFTPEESDEEAPPPRLPQRPPSEQFSPPTQYASARSPSPELRSPPPRSVTFDQYDRNEQPPTPVSGGGYHLYNIYEYITQPGKNKKMPMTLGINIPKGMIMIAPEKSRDGPQQEWTAEKMEYYSQEGKHVFMELKQPSKSVDFHCGAKDTATEIMSALGELAGAAKGAGLREVLAAGSGNSNVQKKGVMLFDFMAQGDDEVTVGLGDEIVVLDDSASDEWWKVRRLKNGKEGVVPANYVEVRETVPISAPAAQIARTGTNAGRSRVEQNRREEEELARQASRKRDSEARNDQRSSKRDSSAKDASSAKSSSKPDPSKVRTWTDRSGSFKVEAQFILMKGGKIHLHKVNGVKIAVPVTKMSVEDLEYVERVTGESLDDDKPLSDLKRRSTQRANAQAPRSPSGITVEKKPEYDWFDFFLKCGVNPQICERYAQAFHKDQMGEENIPDITPGLLRTLGLKEGDILRVTKYLESKYGSKRGVSFAEDGGEEGSSGGLFSGPGGALRNNTRKGRPAPPVQTSDVVDAKAFEQKTDDAVKKPAEATPTPLASAPKPERQVEGFEDNAWDVKPSRTASTSAPPPAQTASASAPKPPTLTGSMNDLSLLDMPALRPELIAQPTPPAPAPQPQAAPLPAPTPAPVQQAQPTGATPSLFDQVAAIKALTQPQNLAPPRMRPQPPQQQNTGGIIVPPPQRSSSAPQNPQQSAFGPPPPLQPQLTGYNPNMMAQVAPPGQSLQDMQNMQNVQRMQQQMTGMPQQNGGFGFQQNGIMPHPTGYNSMSPPPQMPLQTGFAPFQQPLQTGFQQPMQTGFQQPMQTGFQPSFQQNGSPFADPPRAPFQPIPSQPTGYNTFQPSPLNPQATGINRFLPPAIQAQPTGFGQSPPPMPPMPPMPSMPTAQPLVPQKTGPAPPIRFGVQPAKKLTPQPTGKASLANATPQNPFGF